MTKRLSLIKSGLNRSACTLGGRGQLLIKQRRRRRLQSRLSRDKANLALSAAVHSSTLAQDRERERSQRATTTTTTTAADGYLYASGARTSPPTHFSSAAGLFNIPSSTLALSLARTNPPLKAKFHCARGYIYTYTSGGPQREKLLLLLLWQRIKRTSAAILDSSATPGLLQKCRTCVCEHFCRRERARARARRVICAPPER